MILTDTSVVIDFSRKKDPKLLALLPTLPVGVCGIVRAEVLHGTLNPTHRQVLVTVLNSMLPVSIPETLWDTVGDHLAALRSSGVTVPFQDVVLATLAIHLGVELWTRDLHFGHIQTVLPALRLFQEPP